MTIKIINDEILNTVERYIRVDLVALLEKYKGPINLADFFGKMLLAPPEKFEFAVGERAQIIELASFINRIMTGDSSRYGIDVFNFEHTQKMEIQSGLVVYPNLGRFFSDDTTQSDERRILLEKLQTSMYENILGIFKSMNVNGTILLRLTKDLISVKVNDKGKVIRYWPCMLCVDEKPKRKKKTHTLQCKIKGEGQYYWINSNLIKHMKITHKMNPVTATQTLKCKSNNKNLHIRKQISHDGEIKVNHSIEDQIADKCDDGINIEEEDSDEYVGPRNRTIQLSISPNPSVAHANMYEQISQQLLRVDMISKANEQDNKLHDMHFKFNNILRLLKVLPIAGDGNCMFGAIAHQLSATDSQNNEHSFGADEMRKKVVSHIESNFETFEIVLRGRVYDEFGSKPVANMESEKRKILERLSQNGYWGGSETIKAVAEIFKCNILIICEDGDPFFPIAFDHLKPQAIILAYRTVGGCKHNYYDSVIEIHQSIIFELSRGMVRNGWYDYEVEDIVGY